MRYFNEAMVELLPEQKRAEIIKRTKFYTVDLRED